MLMFRNCTFYLHSTTDFDGFIFFIQTVCFRCFCSDTNCVCVCTFIIFKFCLFSVERVDKAYGSSSWRQLWDLVSVLMQPRRGHYSARCPARQWKVNRILCFLQTYCCVSVQNKLSILRPILQQQYCPALALFQDFSNPENDGVVPKPSNFTHHLHYNDTRQRDKFSSNKSTLHRVNHYRSSLTRPGTLVLPHPPS